jgi:hypothetical protein
MIDMQVFSQQLRSDGTFFLVKYIFSKEVKKSMNGFLLVSRRRLTMPVVLLAFALALTTLHPASAQVAPSLVKQDQ